MTKKKENIDEIGFFGLGKGKVNPNTKEFKALQDDIKEHASRQTPKEKMHLNLKALKYQMQSYLDESVESESKSAGIFLKEHIKVTGVKSKFFAEYIGIEPSNLSAIINGKRNIGLELAAKLGQLFEAEAELWLRVQNKNELLLFEKKYRKKYQKISVKDLLKKVG